MREVKEQKPAGAHFSVEKILGNLLALGGQSLTQQLLNVLLTFFLAVISWAKLTDSSIKQHFR